MLLDFKKTEKELYLPSSTPSIVDVPEMRFIVVSGTGDPNGPEFQQAMEVLYGLAYAIKMANKVILEYVVPPLEGLWWTGSDLEVKSEYEWTVMLRQPDFVTAEVFAVAQMAVAKKKKNLDLARARLEKFTEGLCVQAMHIGPYSEEAATIERMKEFARRAGYVFEGTADSLQTVSRHHHEIYFSNPSKTAPEKMKTVLRYPICKEAER